MSSKRCRITSRSGDLISPVDGVTCEDEASVAKETRHGKHTRATILRTFLVRSRYRTSLPCVVIPRRILAYGSASCPRQSQRTQLVSTWPSPGGEHRCPAPLNVIGTSTSRTIQGLLLAGVADHAFQLGTPVAGILSIRNLRNFRGGICSQLLTAAADHFSRP